MMDIISFQTKARTVDHLGREQIADAPTAVSELWKNAYDAYARRAELHIFDEKPTTAVLVDDGHGMNRSDFVNKWLVVGTESKAIKEASTSADRLGLPPRPRQGQKGIGRLSCANLAPVLFLVSKRVNEPFVASLIDWRLFENPFLNLSDIEIPITECKTKEEVLWSLDAMTLQILENLQGGKTEAIRERRTTAWANFDRIHADQVADGSAVQDVPPTEAIVSTYRSQLFQEHHLAVWSVWSGEANNGTALLMSNVSFDLRAQTDSAGRDAAVAQSQDRFFETLSSFVDPFTERTTDSFYVDPAEFKYSVRTWSGEHSRLVLGTGKEFDRATIDQIEHQIIGRVDEDGVFRGRLKAFGKWADDSIEIPPPADLQIPSRADSRMGPIDVFFSSIELDGLNTVHTKQEFERFKDLAAKYAGLLVFRDGLRVLPFGRSDSDFFEIDQRRSRNAGREFWNHRNMFGRVAITRALNPNLKDKAGREGLLDNRAAKTLKGIVENILMVSARRYFGSSSELRENLLPDIRVSNKRKRADEARAAKRRSDRKKFKSSLDKLAIEIPTFVSAVEEFSSAILIDDETSLSRAQKRRDELRDRLADFRLPGAPEALGTLEEKYKTYRRQAVLAETLLANLDAVIHSSIERISPASPIKLLKQQLARNASQIHRRIRNWKSEIEALQRAEYQRVRELIDSRNKVFHAEAAGIVHRLESNDIDYISATDLMELLRVRIDGQNSEIFIPYINALEALRDSVDLDHLANYGSEEVGELRSELDKITSLAQLGIAVEINGHELQSYDEIIGAALRKLPASVLESKAGSDLVFGFEGLTDQLRFLSPLRLAGQKVQHWITGREIYDYIRGFFGPTLARDSIELYASPDFMSSRVFEYSSRILPVYINLVNNSIYWLSMTAVDGKKVALDIVGDEIVVSDNGPGIAKEDEEHLFTLFFTKKVRGGRGVGLYLSKANLSGGGHRIRYQPASSTTPLPGANFYILFRGLLKNEA